MDIDTETLTLRHHNTQYTITIHNLALLAKIDINGGVCMMVPHFGLCSEVDFAGDRGSGVRLCGKEKERAMVRGAMVNVGGCMFKSR